MSPDKRSRNSAVMKDFKVKRESEDPLNNNTALPYTFIHSTPLKKEQVTDLDVVGPVLNDHDVTPTADKIQSLDESDGSDTKSVQEHTEPELVIAKIYELTPSVKTSPTLNSVVKQNEENLENYEIEVTKAELDKINNGNSLNKPEAWKTLEVLDEIAEFEFIKSLEHSKKYLSTSNLLEEIEADLPSTYSLAKPLNHTFHSLASYRTVTRLARMDKNLTCPDDLDTAEIEDVCQNSSKRLHRLETETMVQQANIKQAQKALILSRAKKSMEIENLECEKALLLANLRFSAACQEIEKLKLLGDTSDKENFGQITIWGVQYTIDDAPKHISDNFICTATDRENVQVSSTMYKMDGKLCFDEPIKFQNLNKDFVIYIELFRRVIKETKTPIKACIMKKLKELAGGSFHKTLSIAPSFNHGFECIACAQLRLEHIVKREKDKCGLFFTESPKHPIIGDMVTLRLKTHFNTQIKKCGFLNVFTSTWHRRWYSLGGHFLNSWLYPEDQENDKPPIDSIHLSACKELVKPADLEVCIRPHSFVLIKEPEGNETLFSAESHKDMRKWIDHLNLVIEHIQIWKPNV